MQIPPKPWRYAWGLFLLLVGSAPMVIVQAQIRSDEQVLFFRTEGRLSESGRDWIVPIHGWIYEPEANDLLRRAALRSLQGVLGLEPSGTDAQIFSERCRLFVADNERGKQLQIRVGNQVYDLEPSGLDGHFRAEISVGRGIAAQLARHGWLDFTAVTPQGDTRTFGGQVLLVPTKGISVISDIDDTVKITEVRDRQKMLENTFLKPFRPAPGMAETYQRWNDAGAMFHFVSSSPWQLYLALDQFRQESRLPTATFHLKQVRLKDSSVRELFVDGLTSKPPVIESILRAFPQRQFVLVGDSGEQDPEVYGLIARNHLPRIRRIFIRDVTGEAASSQRYSSAFQGLPTDLCQIFTDPSQLSLAR